MAVADIAMRVPLLPLLVGSIAGGELVGAGLQHAGARPDGHQSLVALGGGVLGGFAVMDGALLVGMKIERTPGPFRDRWMVDGLEQVSHLRVSLRWGPCATVVGTMLAGLGAGIGLASLMGHGTSGLAGPPPTAGGGT